MQATMIRIEPGVKMTKAIERCRKAHPRIRRASADTVTVITSSSTHAVKILTPRPGLLLASCDCQAGIRSQLCLHVAAALAAPWVPASTPAAHKLAGVLVKGLGNVVTTVDGWTV